MKRIPLRGKYGLGKFAIVDDEDYQELNKHYWHCVTKDGYTFYVTDGHRNKMHRVLLNAKYRQGVDHINGDGLDNRKSNLRICTQKENSRNSRRRKNGHSSKYKGVWKKTYQSGKISWLAEITVDRKKKHLGTFKDEEVAAYAYNTAAKKYFGEYAQLNNLPKEKYTIPSKSERIQISIQNLLNKPTQKLITYKGNTHNMVEWSKIIGIKRQTLQARFSRGWSVEKSLETPCLSCTIFK